MYVGEFEDATQEEATCLYSLSTSLLLEHSAGFPWRLTGPDLGRPDIKGGYSIYSIDK